MRYQLTVWFKEQKFDDPKVPDLQIIDGAFNINNWLDNNWMIIKKHEIKCVETGEQCY